MVASASTQEATLLFQIHPELLISILEYLEPLDLAAAGSSCRRLQDITNRFSYKKWYISYCNIEHRYYDDGDSTKWKQLALELQASVGYVEHWCVASMRTDPGHAVEELQNPEKVLRPWQNLPFPDFVIICLCYKRDLEGLEATELEALATALVIQGRPEEADKWYRKLFSALDDKELPRPTWKTIALSQNLSGNFVLNYLPRDVSDVEVELLMLASASGNLEFLKLMRETRNCNLRVRGPSLGTPTMAAASFGRLEVLEYLQECGSLDHKDQWMQKLPFEQALQHGHIETATYLLNREGFANDPIQN